VLVLIVEDDPAVRESLARCLGFEGYDVVSAVDGETGLAAVALHRPDAILLDLQLPRMDGLEVCRRIRASGDGVPILVIPNRELSRDGHPIELTRKEFELLELLMLYPRQVLTRTQILREVWGYDFDPGSNTLEVYMGYLRRKTEEYGGPRLIHTIRGVGYVLRAATQDGTGR
jgi:two-component system, OmpR family, response regulator MprA